ncbi:class I SAM-dependent DNA methyltransferase [Actinomadura atramentaria]|uniref:class I SAM-dependent DNA methyltransferase n=1 Tax=Actinomadura atramentaria TaxID=1990 RepID=UPI00035C2ED8|nr:class I SAM-dependent methyltransferase [Actinomadura atramentaria]
MSEGYDAVADEYAARHADDLEHSPLEAALVDLAGTAGRALGPVADLGCGPGQAARRLHARGVTALGVDRSPRMVALAAAAGPGIGFHVGDFRRLDVPDQAWGGIVARDAVVHLPVRELRPVFLEFFRVLKPGGVAVVTFFAGTGACAVPGGPPAVRHERGDVETALEKSGLEPFAYVETRAFPDGTDTARGQVAARRAS